MSLKFLVLYLSCFSCSQVKTTTQAPCEIGDLDQQKLVIPTCMICHTEDGMEEVPTSKVMMFKMGSDRLRNKIDSLKTNDSNHKFIDTLSSEEIDCIVNYIGRYKYVQP